MRLGWRGWIALSVLLLTLFRFLPAWWLAAEAFHPGDGYRLPYELSDDYWMFQRWSRAASSRYRGLLLGDSVVWGQYVAQDQTLSQCLNRLSGEDLLANAGVDGLHPAALLGMLQYHGEAIAGKGVILHLNLLWMGSARRDLSGEAARFNHPGLVPQLVDRPASYRPSLADVAGIVLERHFALFCLKRHLRLTRLEGMDVQNWTLQNPYRYPCDVVLPQPDSAPAGPPVSWEKRGIAAQELPWVAADSSYQWASCAAAIEVLRRRDNDVLVVIGPFNESLLTGHSRDRYRFVRGQVEQWLGDHGVPHYTVADLPSHLYADASHPLAEGYRLVARSLHDSEVFRAWVADPRMAGPAPSSRQEGGT